MRGLIFKNRDVVIRQAGNCPGHACSYWASRKVFSDSVGRAWKLQPGKQRSSFNQEARTLDLRYCMSIFF